VQLRSRDREAADEHASLTTSLNPRGGAILRRILEPARRICATRHMGDTSPGAIGSSTRDLPCSVANASGPSSMLKNGSVAEGSGSGSISRIDNGVES
jgi:hypothetical protein